MDSYAHYFVLLLGGIGVALLFWLIVRSSRPLRARLPNQCTRCGRTLEGSPERCPHCGMEIDYDDHIAGELDAGLLERGWPSTTVAQRTPEPAEEAITVHTTLRIGEATRLQEQLAARGYACRLETVESSQGHANLNPRTPTFNVKVYTDDLAAARHYLRELRRAARLKQA